jgi:toxin ParE1/3/4
VAKFKLTRQANADIDAIAAYTLTTHGDRQCALYLDDLESSFRLLAGLPDLGRACDEITPGLRRHEHEHHVVFYARKPYGIRVLRVLHERMSPELHSFLDDDEHAE